MRTLFTGLLVLILFVSASATVSVTVSSPTSATAVNTSFTIKASAVTTKKRVTGWYIYVDSNAVWNTAGPTSSISAPITVAAGSHNITVRAWDNSGGYGSMYLSVTATIPISATTVSVLSPASGTSVTDPVTFTASGSSPNGISGWVIYSDNQNVYQVDNYSNSLTASVTLPAGAHAIYIRAWDRISGYGTSPTFSINVGSSTTTANGLPTPPSNATVFTHIEDMTTGWNDCSANCAGGQATTNYWSAAFQGSPSMDGSSREFFNGGGPWANVLWYKSMGAQNFASNFLWDFYVYFDPTTIANLHTAEFDLYQSINGFEWMVGSQCNFGDGDWNTWDQANGVWINTSITCPRWSADTWHHIQWYVQRVSSTQYKYETLVVDGVAYSVNQTYSGSYAGWADVMGVQWQLDLGPNGVPAYEWIDNVKLTIW